MDPLLQEKTTCLSPKYFVSMPEGHKGDKLPLLIYLHGGGSKGVEMRKIDHCIPRLRYGIDKFDKGPCIVVVPQCLAKTEDGTRASWRPEDLNIYLENLMNTLPVDPDRVYLTGNSMGGSGSWAWGGSNPEHFAAIAPVSGGVGSRDSEEVSPKIEAMAKKLATVPVYAFAGEKDDVVSAENSKRMIAAIQKAGGAQAKLTVYPDAGHGAKGITYKSQEFYDWMFSKTRK
jgi:predicted peptidase